MNYSTSYCHFCEVWIHGIYVHSNTKLFAWYRAQLHILLLRRMKTSSTGQPINAMMPVHKNKAKTELRFKKLRRNFVKSPRRSSIWQSSVHVYEQSGLPSFTCFNSKMILLINPQSWTHFSIKSTRDVSYPLPQIHFPSTTGWTTCFKKQLPFSQTQPLNIFHWLQILAYYEKY